MQAVKTFLSQGIRTPRSTPRGTADGSTPSTDAGVTISVTPLTVPRERLTDIPFNKTVVNLAGKESKQGLVDPGGMAHCDMRLVAGHHHHGFIAAATAAFANHYPLAIRPQHVWLLILQGVAKHVELNAETVRKQWVAHEGKKELLVRRDQFVLGKPNDWAGVVTGHDDSFAAQIDANVVDGVADALSPDFAGTTAIERICEKITVMDVCKSFFSYKCMTCCGFPQVTLEGSAADWALLRLHAEKLIAQRCESKWAQSWLSALLPILDKMCVEYAKGADGKKGDEPFWNSMCKRGGTSGSGARTWFNGWINILFPYILERPNAYCVPYSPTAGYVKEGRDGGRYGMGAPRDVQGPDCADFPSGLAEAPVTWDHLGSEKKLVFKAGFVGATQDVATGTVKPTVGWFVAHAGQEQSVMDDPFGTSMDDQLMMAEAHARAAAKPPPRSGFSRMGQKAPVPLS